MADSEDRSGGGWWPERNPGGGKHDREKPRKPETKRPRGLASPGAPKSSSRYSLIVGLAFVAIVVIALLNLLGNDEAGILGVDDDEMGRPLAEFAAPDARGSSEADANVFQDDCESSRNPCPEEEQRSPACEIDPGEAIRVCDLFDKPSAISFWFTRGGDCTPTQDAFDTVAGRYEGRMNFLSVNVRDERETVTDLIAERDWQVPVGLDPDGAISNLYRVGGCPTIVLAHPGGILYRAEIGAGEDEVAEISGFADDLLNASRERTETSR